MYALSQVAFNTQLRNGDNNSSRIGTISPISTISTTDWIMEEVVGLITNKASKQSSALHTLRNHTKLALVRSRRPVRIEKVPDTLVTDLTKGETRTDRTEGYRTEDALISGIGCDWVIKVVALDIACLAGREVGTG